MGNSELNASLSAFPFNEDYTERESKTGLTKREYFAGLAMHGLLACSIAGHHKIPDNLIKDAIEHADLLLKELDK